MEPDEQGRFGFNVQVTEYFFPATFLWRCLLSSFQYAKYFTAVKDIYFIMPVKDNGYIFLGRCGYQFASYCVKDRSGNAGKSFILGTLKNVQRKNTNALYNKKCYFVPASIKSAIKILEFHDWTQYYGN